MTELDTETGDSLDPLVRVWPTDPGDDRGGQWVPSSMLRLADQCPDHCPRCSIDLKAEGYPIGHKNDDGNQCEWRWEPPDV